MSKTSKCSECGNKKWRQKDKDNFICVKCKQKEKQTKRKTEKGGRMTKEEAIKHGKEQLEIFWGKNMEFTKVALRSLAAWDAVKKDILKFDTWGAYEVIDILDKHLKEVEE